MNKSHKHLRLRYQQLISMNTGVQCSMQFIYWMKRNSLSIAEVRYLINDGWHLEKSPSKSFKLHSAAVYGNAVKELI